MRSRTLRANLTFTAAALLAIAGCGEQSSNSDTPEQTEVPAPTSYTLSGEIRAIPSAEAPAQELMIKHGEIPDFVGPSGEVVGMRAMTMPFPNLAEGVSIDRLEVGDRVEFTFRVDYAADPKYVVTKMTELPPAADDDSDDETP